jgi:threonine/homoserine/homoserine lactone efflux protein
MMDIFDNLKTAMQNDQGIIVGVLAALGVAVAFFTFSVVVPAIASVIVALAPAILVMALVAGAAYLLYTAWTTNFGGIRDILTAVWYGTLLPALTQLWTWLQVTIPIALAWLSATWTTIWATIQDVFKVFVAAIKGIYDLFQLAFTGQWVKLGEELRVICDNAWKILKALWAEFKLWFEKTTDTMIQNVKNFFTNTNWGQVGQDIVHGIANGITAGASWVMDAINKVIADAMAVISGFTGKVASGAASVTVAPGSTPYPARAGGGSVSANVPYLVGENGPELFVPGANGDIVSNGQMGNTYILNVYTSQSPDVVTQSFGMMKALAGG